MYEYDAKITKVVDGDTFDATVDLGFHISIDVRFRLLGVDCPEVRGESREAGLAAAEYTRSRLMNKSVRLQSRVSPGPTRIGTDSFGRWLARVLLIPNDGGTPEDFAQTLLTMGHARIYM